MFEQTNSRNQPHVDERAHKFFSLGWGEDYLWNGRHKDLLPTSVVSQDDFHVCAYCGFIALPICDLRDEYCCVCKDAMDELEMVGKINEIKKQLQKAISQCHQAMPKTNPKVLEALVERKAKIIKNYLKFFEDDGEITFFAAREAGVELKGTRYEGGEG